MLFAVVVSALVAVCAASGVLLVQAVAAQNRSALETHQRAVAELARSNGGILTPPQVAEHFSITYVEADRLLRSMVDDTYVGMKVDDRQAELVYWFTELVEEPNKQSSRAASRNKSGTPRPKPKPLTRTP